MAILYEPTTLFKIRTSAGFAGIFLKKYEACRNFIFCETILPTPNKSIPALLHWLVKIIVSKTTEHLSHTISANGSCEYFQISPLPVITLFANHTPKEQRGAPFSPVIATTRSPDTLRKSYFLTGPLFSLNLLPLVLRPFCEGIYLFALLAFPRRAQLILELIINRIPPTFGAH